jgi:hypothetical protein
MTGIFSFSYRKSGTPLWLQNQFVAIVARPFRFPQFLRFSVGVFSKVNASISVRACGMHGTDEVWVAAVEETAIALREFGHGGRVEVLVWV